MTIYIFVFFYKLELQDIVTMNGHVYVAEAEIIQTHEQNGKKDFFSIIVGVPLRVWYKSANVPKPYDEEGDCLDIKEYEVVVFPKESIIAATKE
jgi:hypothetical protein